MKSIFLSLAIIGISILGFAQEEKPIELRKNFNESGSHYIKATFLNQVWVRYNESNPGTQVMGEAANQTLDIGLRRTRLQFYGQVTDHVFFYTQFGMNNFNFLSQNNGNRKLQAFFHDVVGEYKVWKDNDQLKIGGGLTIANGLSRFSQPSVTSIMTMDVPVFAQATVDQTDEFSRKLSMYARGQVGKLDYRIVMSDPFPVTTNGQAPPVLSDNSSFSTVGHHKQFQGFFAYNFFDKEGHTTPYMTGTYLGNKKVLNIEAGFISQAKALWSKSGIDTVYNNMNLWSVAIFYDAPINAEKGNALSAYIGYFNYDYGKGYIRSNGIMNPANGVSSAGTFSGTGNSFPMFGTGSIVYTQVGYLFRKDLLGNQGTLMPYASLMSADYDRLKDRMNIYNLGVNWLINGHTSKITLDYQSRPIFELRSSDLIETQRKGQFVLQYQIFI